MSVIDSSASGRHRATEEATSAPPSDFEQSWWSARRRNDIAALKALALDCEDRGAVPGWLREEIRKVCSLIAEDLSGNINRQDDSDLAAHLIQLSSMVENIGCMYSLLGLAYQCFQPSEQGHELNSLIPDLLDSQLAVFDFYPRDLWPDFALAWRELAIRRVEVLVRQDVLRRVHALVNQYLEDIQMAHLIRVYEPAEPYLNSIRSKISLLHDAQWTLEKYIPLLEDDSEREVLLASINSVRNLISAGSNALNVERR